MCLSRYTGNAADISLLGSSRVVLSHSGFVPIIQQAVVDRASRRTAERVTAVSRIILVALAVAILSGCGTMANDRGWGQDATIAPGWRRIGQAVLNAATAPETWMPAVGATALQIGNADHDIAEWAAKNTPVFGSQNRADRMSDHLRDTASVIWIATAAAAPSGHTSSTWWSAKARGLAVQAGGGAVLRQGVGYLKRTTDRKRPNGGSWAFPSLHAGGTASYATYASRNLETLPWTREAKNASQIGLGALTAATAWSRVEANQHYPSDVLAGIALGHFLAAFFNDAFIGKADSHHIQVNIDPLPRGMLASVRMGF